MKCHPSGLHCHCDEDDDEDDDFRPERLGGKENEKEKKKFGGDRPTEDSCRVDS